jgi:hypothetical protein
MSTEIKAVSNKAKKTFTISKYNNGKLISKYRTIPLSNEEFEENELNTQSDWLNFLKNSNEYSEVKKTPKKTATKTPKKTATKTPKKTATKTPKKTATKNSTKTKTKNNRISVNSLLGSTDKNKIGLGMVYKVKNNLSDQFKGVKEKRALTRKMNIIKTAFISGKMDAKTKESLHKIFMPSFQRAILEEKPIKTDSQVFEKLYEQFKEVGNRTQKKDPKQELADIKKRLGLK